MLAADVEPAAVLTDLAREYVQRFGLRYDFWRLAGKDHDGFPTVAELAAVRSDGTGFYADGESGSISLRHDQGPPDSPLLGEDWELKLWSVDLSVKGDRARIERELASREAIVRTLIKHYPVLRAHIERRGSTMLPAPPHADPDNVLFVADRAEVERDYADPQVYWHAWDSATDLREGRVLVTRALEVTDEVEYKRRIWTDTWAMAHAARPGLTYYYHSPWSDISPGEAALLDRGERTLWMIGYHPEEHWLEYTAMVPDGEHITARDVFLLHDWVVAKEVDGQPLKVVRVTFPDRKMAEREARVLLDIGVTVQYYSDDGICQTLPSDLPNAPDPQ